MEFVEVFTKGDSRRYTAKVEEGTLWVNHLGKLVCGFKEDGVNLVWKEVDIDSSSVLREGVLSRNPSMPAFSNVPIDIEED